MIARVRIEQPERQLAADIRASTESAHEVLRTGGTLDPVPSCSVAKRSTAGWQIVANVAIGPIHFGMTRAQVRQTLGRKPTTFKKTPDSQTLTDAFTLTTVGGDIVHVFYDVDDRCDFIEIRCAGLAGPELDGRSFANRPYDRALAWVRERDPDVTVDEAGLRSIALGIAIHSPAEKIESIAAFASGYWDR